MDVLITGSDGQLGKALKHQIKSLSVTALNKHDLDIRDKRQVRSVLKSLKPKIIFNCAALTDVDKAEENEKEAFGVNADGVMNLAIEAERAGGILVHYSSDYVFHGMKSVGYNENDRPSPINAYGRSKRQGDKMARLCRKHLIFRVSSVWNEQDKNIYTFMLNQAMNNNYVEAPNHWRSPCNAHEVARATIASLKAALLQTPFPSGTYHMCPPNHCSQVIFARLMLDFMRKEGIPHRAKDVKIPHWPKRAPRPRNSVMDSRLLRARFNVTMPRWEESMFKALRKLKKKM